LKRSICSSKTRKVQIDLSGKELEGNRWKMLGFVDACFLASMGIGDFEKWAVKFLPEQMDEIYAKMGKSEVLLRAI
jgi:hypothetical protein